MKTIFICMCMLAMSVTVSARDLPESVTASAGTLSENVVSCKVVYQFAEALMDCRQNGDSMLTVVELVSKDGGMTPYLMSVIKEAYSKSAYRTERFKSGVTVEFANSKYLECLEIMGSK
jgi:hypothetical protein